MLEVVLLVAVAWALLALAGVAVLAAVPPTARAALLPAAPLVGAAFLVVGLHATGIVLPVRWGLVVLAVVAVALVAVGSRRGCLRPFADRASLGWTAAAVAVGAPLAGIAAAPSLALGDGRVVSPAGSHDAFWYVSVSRWLQSHSILDVPDIPAAPAAAADGVLADGPTVSSLTAPLRVGQELVQAALNTVTGTAPTDTFSPWIAAWVLLVPGGCLAAAVLMGLSRWVGLAAGVLIAGSAVLVQQVYSQNAASVLGIALVLPVLGCVVAALDRRPPVPLLLAALMLSGVVGTYTEYAPFLAPALAGAVLLRRQGLGRTVARAAALLGLAIAIAPLVWWRALGTILGVRGGAADAWPSPFLARPQIVINRLVGAGPLSGGFDLSLIALALGALVFVGMVLAVVLGPQRGMWLGLLAVGLAFLAYLSVQRLGYTHRRAVEIAVPLALFMCAAGWAALVDRLRGRHPASADRPVGRLAPALPMAVTAALLACLVVWTGVNVRSSLASDDDVDLAGRHVDEAYAEAQGWVEEIGDDGEAVSVLVPDFFEQHWIAMALADEKAVEYPAVRADYFRTESFWSGGADRFWLVGDGVQVDADEGVVVETNARFRLLDLEQGEAVVAAPYRLGSWYPLVLPDSDTATIADGAGILVLRSPGGDGDVSLAVRAGPDTPLLVRLEPETAPTELEPVQVTGATDVQVTLPAGDSPVILDVDTALPGGGTAPMSIELEGIHRER